MLDDPAWSLVHTVEGSQAEDVLELPQLRAVHGITEACAVELASGAPRSLVELGWVVQWSGPRALTTCKALPDLRVLAMSGGTTATLEWLAGAPVLARIERVLVPRWRGTRELIAALAARRGSLRTVEVVAQTRHASLPSAPGWHMIASRSTAPGPFEHVVAVYRGGERRFEDAMEALCLVLEALPERTVRELVIQTEKRIPADDEDLAMLWETLAPMRIECIETPWKRAPRRA